MDTTEYPQQPRWNILLSTGLRLPAVWFPQAVETAYRQAATTSSEMTDTHENAHRHLADDTRFRPLNEQHERFYYTDAETGEPMAEP